MFKMYYLIRALGQGILDWKIEKIDHIENIKIDQFTDKKSVYLICDRGDI